uniref:Anterior gradient 1 n=1 Tax=Poecilia latipinna TaxID=48699 RepID=A0A3B3V6N0_9TELE
CPPPNLTVGMLCLVFSEHPTKDLWVCLCAHTYNRWGKNIKWVKSYEEGLAESAKSQKPLIVIHHLENCPHSKALKEAFVAHKSIQKMAKDDFIMLNVVEETGDKHLAPDGYYVPRILFVDPSHTVRADIVGNYEDRLYTYSPDDMELLAANMKKAKLLLHSEL